MKWSIGLILLVITALHSSCEKSSSSSLDSAQFSMAGCGGDQPAKTLPWLKSEIERLSSSAFCHSISRSTYKNQTVFIVSNCEPNVDSVPILYTCDGRQLNLTMEEYRNLSFTGPIELVWKNR